MINDSVKEFNVVFNGPADSVYTGGMWKVRVELAEDYPYSSPSIGFVNKIFHPNIDFESGAVCVDVLNQKWNPVIDLVNIFEIYLPELLKEPNPEDPLNADAAALLLSDEVTYEAAATDYRERFSKPEHVGVVPYADSSDGEPSEDDNDSEKEAKAAGSVDP